MQTPISIYNFYRVPFSTAPGWEMDEYMSESSDFRTCSERKCFVEALRLSGIIVDDSYIDLIGLEMICLRNNIYVRFIDV